MPTQHAHLEWDWELEHEDRKAEAQADAAVHGALPFQVDRKLLKDIVHERMEAEVARIKFLGAGTFHKGYLITLVDGREVVARVARRFMPRLKTESEVATMRYLREHTSIPVPTVYQYDANPYNRLGGEYILMSKAPGIALSRVFHSMPHSTLVALMDNLAGLLIPLFAHRFPRIGSLYDGPDPAPLANSTSTIPTPTPTTYLRSTNITAALTKLQQQAEAEQFHVGPIISWPFFGSNRGEQPQDVVDRGPWRTTHDYLVSCVEREVKGVVLENEGKAAPHKIHLDPDEIHSSWHHRMTALPDDQSDMSDEWDIEESEAEWEGPGDAMYQDYRRMQRSTFLVAHLSQREQMVKEEMARFLQLMERLGVVSHGEGDGGGGEQEEFALDCHDLNLENLFVDEADNSKITCIIDWESTTTRPLWACTHVPAFLQSSPFTSKLFRATIERLAAGEQPLTPLAPAPAPAVDIAATAAEWLHHEATGTRLRMAHRCIEWDGWEEGLVESILGPADAEDDWFKTWDEDAEPAVPATAAPEMELLSDSGSGDRYSSGTPPASGSPTLVGSGSEEDTAAGLARKKSASPLASRSPLIKAVVGAGAVPPMAVQVQVPKVVVAMEKEREKLLNVTGDICGGRGGELGRRLEAWLYVNGDEDGRVGLERRWTGESEVEAV